MPSAIFNINRRHNGFCRAVTLLILFTSMLAVYICLLMPKISPADKSEEYFDTEGGRLYYLGLCGWDAQPLSADEVTIPESFSEVYERYNRLQKLQGFDIEAHRGESVLIYTYSISNHPEAAENVRAALIVSDGRLIGGDVSLCEPDGFMHGLNGEKN